MIAKEDTLKFFTSILEREVIFINKELLRLPKEQWTNVSVYKNYRFCNVHRCYDKTYILIKRLSDMLGGIYPGLRTVLRWLASNPLLEWLIYNFDEPDLYPYIIQANDDNPEELFKRILKAYHNGVIPLVSGSFIVKRYGNDLEEMLAYYKAGTEFDRNVVCAYTIEGTKTTTKEAVKFFKDHAPWCADFGAYCIVSDWIYLLPDMFTDLYDWTAYGPGAFNGINLIVPTTKREYLAHLKELHAMWKLYGKELLACVLNQTDLSVEQLDDLCRLNGYLPMSKLLTEPLMLDVEHWLCEYAKYVRGWAKKRYN